MLRIYYLVILAIVLTAGMPIGAQPMMGNWEGEITSGANVGESLTAKVVIDGEQSARMILKINPDKESARRIVFNGNRRGREIAVFIGSTYTEEDEERYVMTAETVDRRMTGKIYGEDRLSEFVLEKVELESPTLGAKPPANAVVLFDGSDLDAWRPTPDHIENGAMRIVSSRSFVSKQEFGDHKLHLEFRTPLEPEARGQGRGNSGVYLQGRYEVQVLDSFGDEPRDNLCGGIYEIATPLVNVCLPPTVWQTYDITFQAPRFNKNGKKTKDAEITVLQNGILIHDTVKIPRTTNGGITDEEGEVGPLFLQDHGNRVQFRNIWIEPL